MLLGAIRWSQLLPHVPRETPPASFGPSFFQWIQLIFGSPKPTWIFAPCRVRRGTIKNYGLAHNALGHAHLRLQNQWYFNNLLFCIMVVYNFYYKNQYETHTFQKMPMLIWPRGALKSALAIRHMKTQLILTFLSCRVRRRDVFDTVVASLRATRGAILGRVVLQMTVCVTFGAPLLDVYFRNVSNH